MGYLPRSQWKQRSRPLLPLPHEQDRAAGWARPYSSASLIRRPPSPTAAWRAASLVTSSCKKYTINRQTVSEVHFHSNRSLKLTKIHTSNEVTKILKSTTWCRILRWYIIRSNECQPWKHPSPSSQIHRPSAPKLHRHVQKRDDSDKISFRQ